MRKCSLCKVEILDSTNNCPLCHNILEWDGVEVEGMYPDARIVLRKNRIMENIVLFVSIVAFVVVVSLGKLLQWDWRIPGTRDPVGLPSIGSHRVRHD